MHYTPSAKRGIEIACCLSVRPYVRMSVTLVDRVSGSHELEIFGTNCTGN